MRPTRLHIITGIGLIAVLLLTVAGPLRISHIEAANLATRRLQVSTAQAGSTANYKISLSGQSSGNVGSVRLQICVEDPFVGAPCTGPGGLSFLGASLVSQTGMTGFTIHPSSTANELILTRVPAPNIAGQVTFELAGVVNPSAADTYFGRLETFVSTDATGANRDGSGLAYAIPLMALPVLSRLYAPEQFGVSPQFRLDLFGYSVRFHLLTSLSMRRIIA